MGSVLHRTTLRHQISVSIYDYALADYVRNPDIGLLTGIPSKHWHINGDDTLREMTTAEKWTAHSVANKKQRVLEIDQKTQELIRAGFIHASKTFSLSIRAQMNWSRVKTGAAADLSYPYTATNIDDTDYHDFADEAEMIVAADAAEAAKKDYIKTGSDFKKDIINAADQIALDLVVDSR